MFSPDKPKIKRKAEWRRIGAFFLPYWRQEALVLVCISYASIAAPLPHLLDEHVHAMTAMQTVRLLNTCFTRFTSAKARPAVGKTFPWCV